LKRFISVWMTPLQLRNKNVFLLQFANLKMNRTDPTFKENAVITQENIEFLNELFDALFDFDDTNGDMDKVPDLGILDRVR